jgi:1,4-dihydroxy-2-naphthoate octaprenyltransferase
MDRRDWFSVARLALWVWVGLLAVAMVVSLTTGAFGPPPWWGWVIYVVVLFAISLFQRREYKRREEVSANP